jgi:hypothetical protein
MTSNGLGMPGIRGRPSRRSAARRRRRRGDPGVHGCQEVLSGRGAGPAGRAMRGRVGGALRAIRQRIANSRGSLIRHRITPLNVSRSRYVRRRLVAVPGGTARRQPAGRSALKGSFRVAGHRFSRPICELSDGVTAAGSRRRRWRNGSERAPERHERHWATATDLSDALAVRADKK